MLPATLILQRQAGMALIFRAALVIIMMQNKVRKVIRLAGFQKLTALLFRNDHVEPTHNHYTE